MLPWPTEMKPRSIKSVLHANAGKTAFRRLSQAEGSCVGIGNHSPLARIWYMDMDYRAVNEPRKGWLRLSNCLDPLFQGFAHRSDRDTASTIS